MQQNGEERAFFCAEIFASRGIEGTFYGESLDVDG